jgi:hypothetical protein
VPGRGLKLLVRRSMTDQQGAGQDIAVWANPDQPGLCPLAALDAWLVHRRTAAAGDRGAGLAELIRQTRHKSTEVALGYLRPADLWRNNVTEGVFRAERKVDET